MGTERFSGKDLILIGAVTEIAKSNSMVGLLRERSDQVTSSELELSCIKPYSLYSVAETIFELQGEVGMGLMLPDDEGSAIDAIRELPAGQIKDMFSTITLGYRQATLNLLLGVGAHYKKADGYLPELGPSAKAPHELVEMALLMEAFPVLNPDMVTKAALEEKMHGIRIDTHRYWSPMFDDRRHKILAREYLTNKLNDQSLRKVIDELPLPTFKFT